MLTQPNPKSCETKMKPYSIKNKLLNRVSRSRRGVFLRSDFEKIAGYDQVGRVLRELTKEGKLIRIGYGLYAKARLNRLTNQPMLAAQGGFKQTAEEALERLKVKWEATPAVKAYQMGSTQIPVQAEVMVSDRFSRKIATEKFNLRIIRD